ncbi:MAG: hypothetical protein PWP03_140 [Candidatus Woesearchaeota archaeon]|nr:hypothetical protein [Candidatus Woesearchaeota archaeon]MDN5327502.1 hypothetical protein [Candidatus Woesearchaeota archaeon]
MSRVREITLVNAIPPEDNQVNTLIQWYALSLGLFSARDRDKTCFRIFLELLRNSKNHIAVSSEDLSLKLKVSRGTIVHHLKKLENSGIVDSQGNRYFLTSESLEKLANELRKQVNEIFDKIADVGSELDSIFDSLLKR